MKKSYTAIGIVFFIDIHAVASMVRLALDRPLFAKLYKRASQAEQEGIRLTPCPTSTQY
jgi:hypothetical protein